MTLAMMYDDVSAPNYPDDGDGYAAYANGGYNDYAAVKARFPNKPVKSISVAGLTVAELQCDISDQERGDYTSATAAQWASLKIASGYGRPTCYCSTSNYGDLANALAAQRLQFGVDVDWWEAHYDGVAELSTNPGAVAKQYASAPTFDTSVADPVWLGIVIPVPAIAKGLKRMTVVINPLTGLRTIEGADEFDDTIIITEDPANTWTWANITADATGDGACPKLYEHPTATVPTN